MWLGSDSWPLADIADVQRTSSWVLAGDDTPGIL